MNFADWRGARILAVDDDVKFTRMLTTLLNMEGYTMVKVLNDPAAAVGAFIDFKPDIVLLDMNMPGLSGLDLLQLLKSKGDAPWVPFLVISAETDSETLVRALELGAVDFVRKPFQRTEVMLRVRNALELSRMHKALRKENAELQDTVVERGRELEEARLDIVRRLARCAEYRDDETGNHIVRVGRLAERLAIAHGMPETRAAMLRESSAMHDIGKVGIPDNILLKPGKLDPDEWERMKLHTLIGATLLSGGKSEIMRQAEQIALSHHEKWDGTGYPMGLAGEAIPLDARITAVCDVLDALTSARPYKAAWEPDRARDHIAGESGKHFDPELVKLFLQEWPRLLEIRSRYLSNVDPKGPAS